jgi:two-component system, NtrC family, response regulator GlrR
VLKQRKASWATPPLSTSAHARRVTRFTIEVLAGPDTGMRAQSSTSTFAIGTMAGNDLVLTDRAVSRQHCRIDVREDGFVLHDLGSRNGTQLGGYRVGLAYLRPSSTIHLGQSQLRFEIGGDPIIEPLSEHTRFGELIGESPAMRRTFFVLERAAATDTTVLFEGETGTGKTALAQALHAASPRAARPFVVIDCGAVAASVIERELFGHAQGAFTGAAHAAAGLFEAAAGGTVFLDEIGELPLDVQPKLLRAIEHRTIVRVGSTRPIPLDVRVLAATNRDLAASVNRGRFRADLFYRVSTLRVCVPALRERLEDIAPLVTRLYRELAATDADPPADLIARAQRHHWPGNIRELRNFVERSVVLGPNDPVAGKDASEVGAVFRDAKAAAIHAWEREWLGRLIRAHDGNLSRAARSAQMDRNYLRDLLVRHGLAT